VESTRRDKGNRSAWGAVGAAAVLASALALLAPPAVAQSSAAKPDAEVRRYAEQLGDAFRFAMQNFVDKPDADAAFGAAMKGMLESLGDTWTTYLDEAEWRDIRGITTGGYAGIGAYISKQAKDPAKKDDQVVYIEIISPMEGTPAWRQGLQPGDLIVKIDGQSTAGFSSTDAQKLLMGPPGTSVALTIQRGDVAPFEATIVRAQVEIPAVKSALIPTKAGNVAYLRIIDFTLAAKGRVYEALRDFDSKGYSAMIVDVRNNPGGLYISAVDIADAFLDSGTIVSTRGRDPLADSADKARPDLLVPKDKPVVLLINKGSASASEILAGALKDNKRAYVVGENSYGKGSVQQVVGFEDTGYKITTARYYTPSGENIDKTGIPPDLEAKDPDLTDEEAATVTRLLATGRIAAYAKAAPGADAAGRNAFADELAKDGFDLPQRILRILVANELGRTRMPPAYDLEFDTALNAALGVLANPKYAELLSSAKTVREIVEQRRTALGAPAGAATKAGAGAGPSLPVPEPKD
jgi:carboxyl-terminal processing protease